MWSLTVLVVVDCGLEIGGRRGARDPTRWRCVVTWLIFLLGLFRSVLLRIIIDVEALYSIVVWLRVMYGGGGGGVKAD